MPISAYMSNLRRQVGSGLVLMPAVGALIWNEAGEVLLQQRQDNLEWDIAAGAIDPGEEPAQTLVREVWEETGLKVVPRRLVGVFGGRGLRVVYPNGDLTEYTMALFACEPVGGELRCRDGEAVALRYFPWQQLPRLNADLPPWVFDPASLHDPFVWDPQWLDPLV